MKKKTKKTKKKTVKKKKLTTSKVCCTICKECKGMSKARKERLVGVFGSLEEVHAKYVCRTCRKANNVRRDGKAKPVKRKRKPKLINKWRDETGEIILPDWMKTICQDTASRPASPDDLRMTNVCHRPDLNVGTQPGSPKYFCPKDCPYHLKDACGCSTKKFKGEKKPKKKKAAKKKTKKAKKA
jgi:hypothetical protein